MRLRLKNGLTIITDIHHIELWKRMIQHYSISPHDAPVELWACPWCGGSIDHSSGELVDDFDEDTYHCEGACELLITHTTPHHYTQYGDVPLSEWTVLVESTFNNFWHPPKTVGEGDDDEQV